MLASGMKAILPRWLKQRVRNRVAAWRRKLKAPRMDVGYRDADGTWHAGVHISDTAHFDYPERIRIGDRAIIWHYTLLDGFAGIDIGEGCQIGAWVGVFTHSSHIAIRVHGRSYGTVPPERRAAYGGAPVKIGAFTFIGARATILPGVSIGRGCIVSAGAVVGKDVPDFAIVAGSPAVYVGDTRRLDRKFLADPTASRDYAEWTSGGTAALGD